MKSLSSSCEILKRKNNQQIVLRVRGKGRVNWAECRQLHLGQGNIFKSSVGNRNLEFGMLCLFKVFKGMGDRIQTEKKDYWRRATYHEPAVDCFFSICHISALRYFGSVSYLPL